MVEAYVALGSNVGNREENIKKAIGFFEGKICVLKASSIYETKPMYVEDQGWFLNCALKVETELPARQLLQFLKGIEKKLGREMVMRNGPRIIDLDILFYGDEVFKDEDLEIPHPRIQERAFVLVPLAEIAPKLMHPVYKKTLAELLSELEYEEFEIKKVATIQENRK